MDYLNIQNYEIERKKYQLLIFAENRGNIA